MESETIRTRIAPSPTGNLHVGTARTALFNELFAKKNGGQFIIRIEDTDQERSLPEYEKSILDGLKWMGLSWDEGPDIGGEYGPYRQSERKTIHTEAIKRLLESGHAYQVEDGEAIKLKVKADTIVFNDLIRGEVKVHTDSWGGDFVIARNINDPVFHLAVVVDDAEQKITHVIRGEDHLVNTARHILLQRALGYRTPEYAHLPLLLDEQRKKLSKRSGETNLLAWREAGYLPEALLNYLVLLGWNGGDDKEFFTHEELYEQFTIKGIQKGGAIFSEKKLQAVNKHYIRQLTASDLLEYAKPWLSQGGYPIDDIEYWQKAVALEQERVATLSELVHALDFFRTDWDGNYPAERLVWRKSDLKATDQYIVSLADKLAEINENDFTENGLTESIMTWLDGQQWGRGDVLWPMRVALTGRENSPGPFEVAAVLGKRETLERLSKAHDKIKKYP